jgi:hemolysin D
LGEARHELDVQHERLAEARATKASVARQRDQAVAEFATSVLTDLAKAEEKRGELDPALVKAQTRSAQTQLRAPVDGVVEQLAVHTLGGVVQPAQRLLMVVPDTRDLLIEAGLSDRDVGFVHPGDRVGVKVEAFNFTRYGVLKGRVLQVSRDVVTTEDRGPGDADTNGQVRPLAPEYVARIVLDTTSLMVDGVRQPLRPGMAVTAEITTGRRTIMDYLLSPLARRTNESLHER